MNAIALTLLRNLLAPLFNSDKVASYVRAIASAWVAGFAVWIGAKIPLIGPLLTENVQLVIVTTIVGLVMGAWGHIAKLISAPTPTEIAKVTAKQVEVGFLTAAEGAEAKIAIDESIK